MSRDSELPIILGSGLTGMSISHTLARARIPHVLVGGPPGTLPRLGESLNLEGTLLLLEMFPDLARFYFPKRAVVGYMGDYGITCDFDTAEAAVSRGIFRALGYTACPEFLQFDRLGFDAALYEATAASEFCRVVDAKVEELEYDPAADAFGGVRLADGTTLRPSYLFDASNHGRLLGKATGIGCTPIGEPQRVVYTHYHAPPGAPLGIEAWEAATVIVRLFRDTDSVDGIAWCIPLGSYTSVGVSMSAAETDLPDDDLLELTERAFARYGLRYRERFATPAPTMGLNHGYFAYERAAGANWLLAGPSYCQVWWMAGAGVGTALAAASIAPRVVEDPRRWGAEYDRYIRRIVGIHGTFDFFALAAREEVTPEALHRQSDRFVVTNLVRLAASTRLRDGRLAKLAAPLLGWAFTRPGAIREYCSVERVALQPEAERAAALAAGAT